MNSFDHEIEKMSLKIMRLIGWGYAFLIIAISWFYLHKYDFDLANNVIFPVILILIFCMYRAFSMKGLK